MNVRPIVLALSFLSLAPRVALAQVSDADRATARALAQQGQDALDKKDYANAADRFGRAESLVHAPTLLLGFARAQAGLGKLVSAQEAYARIVREGAPAGSPPAFAKAVAEAKKELAAIEPRIPSVVIQVQGSASSQVTLDGVGVPNAALGVNRPVDPGKHVVRAEAEGFAPAEETVMAWEGKSATITLVLKPAARVPVAPASVVPAPQPSPVVAAPSSKPITATVSPTTPTTTALPVPASLEPAPSDKAGSPQRVVGLVALGVGVAGLGLGVGTGVVALGKHTTLAEACPDPQQCFGQSDTIQSYHQMGTLSTVGFVAGGALAVTGVVLLVTAPKAKRANEVSVVPVVGLGYVGAEGRF